MADIDKAKKLISENFDSEKATDLFELAEQIEKFGLNIIRNVYPSSLFEENFRIIRQFGLYEDPIAEKCQENNEEFLSQLNKINTINMDWIKYFIIFAEIGNTTEAAQHLNITPQTLIKAITGIENYLKLQLVNRKKHFKGLTPVGQLFLEKALIIFQNLYDIEKYFSDLRFEPLKGTISIACTVIWDSEILAEAIINFKQKFPDVSIRLFSMIRPEVEKWLGTGEIDIGLLSTLPVRNEIDYIKGTKIPYVIVGKPGKKGYYKDFNYIVPISIDKTIDNTIINEMSVFSLTTSLGSDNLNMALDLCEKGLGVYWLPEISSVKKRIAEGRLGIISDSPIEKYSELYIAWNKNIHINKPVKALINEINGLIKK